MNSGSFPELEQCRSTTQLIPSSPSIPRSESYRLDYLERSGLAQSLAGIHNLSVGDHTYYADNSTNQGGDEIRNEQSIPRYSSPNPTFLLQPPDEHRTAEVQPHEYPGVFTIPILPDYSSLLINQQLPPFPPPKYHAPPSYDTTFGFHNNELHLTTPTTMRPLPNSDRMGSTTSITTTTPATRRPSPSNDRMGSTTTITTYHDDEPPVKMSGTILLSCFVFWFCGFIFGAAAFIASVAGKRNLRKGNHRLAKISRDASYFFSTIGLLTGFVAMVLVASIIFGTVFKHTNCRSNACWS